ncbi:MAG: hypothetical protein E7520_02130 [Ruminococcaceae bacterium]|nr:hypothetical protein [Oscillospiraceae bacterium]
MRSSIKKTLAVILSVLMVMTTVPFASLTALAEDDAAITAYNSAVDAYASKMDGTVYTGMGTAYAAFVDANEAYDAYVYGQGTASALTSATNSLVTATNNMSAWTKSVANASVYSRDKTTTAINNNYAKNILYAEKQDTLVDEGSNANVRVQIQYGANNVLMYDGTNDILFPVAVFYFYDAAGFSSRKMFTMYPSNGDNVQRPADSSDFRLQGQWKGKMDYGTADWDYAYSQTDLIPGYQYDSGLTPDGAPNGNRNKWNYFANYMKYVGGANGFTDGLKTLHPSWYAYTGYSSTNNRVDHYLNNAGNIYIIDYATALAAINTKTYLAQADDYKSNGLAAYMNAYDALTVDLASYDYSSNTATTAANVASSLASAAATVNATTSPDSDAGYTALRAAMTASKVAYSEGNDDNYYPSNYWTTFKNAYEAAQDNMTNLPSNGYSTSAAAQTLADRLNTAYNNLINSVQNADTTALESAIDDAAYAISNSAYWTATSFANADLQNVIDAAKVAVWTSVDRYKSDRAKSQTSEETVAAQLENVQNAVKKLVIDKNATCSSVGNYSANTAKAHANDTSVFTPNDYANWDTVTAAITAADGFDTTISTYSENCAANKISAYISIVRGIISALNNLKDAFSKMENGQLIAAGDESEVTTAVGSPDSLGAGQDFRTSFWGNNNSIVFRTTHAAAYLPLPDSHISIWTQSGYPLGLDCININDPCEYANGNGNGQITSGGNGDNRAVGDDVISQWNIGAGLVAQNDGYNPKEGRLVLGKVDGRSDSGIYANASRVAAISDNVYAIAADGTMARTTEAVDEQNRFATELTDILGTFDNIDNHPNNSNYGAYGAVWTSNNGTTEVVASTSLYVTVEDSNKLTKNTKLSIDEYSFTDKRFGAVLWWKYMNINTFGYTYHGFRHDWSTYSRTVQVVDIADLFRLIDQCENAGYVASEYTNASWSAYTSALAAAKGDMDYSDQTAEWVLEQCQDRYDDLWAAKEALVKAADRTALLEARDTVKDVHDAGKNSSAYGGPWSDESWSAFDTYYNAVVTDLNGKYSATGVRDYQYYDATGTQKSDAQQDIEARAAELIRLRNALQSGADFTPLDNAVEALRTKVTGGQFTTASIAAANAALQDVDYFWLSDAQRKAIYASAQADADIAAAAAAVTAAGNLLVAVDDAVVDNADDLAGAVADLLAQSNKDPDAYDYAAVQSTIAALEAKTVGAVVFNNNAYYPDLSTTGYTWQHLSELEGLITNALSENYKTYNITITGVSDAAKTKFTYTIGGQEYTATGATLEGIPYGTSVKFTAPDEQFVNWYYTFTSATAQNTKEKYLTNDKEINFIVNGNVNFRLDNETDVSDADKVRVTYASSLRSTAYKIEYMSKGDLVLEEAPVLANYSFTGYTIDGANYNAGDTVSITKHTVIIANYECENEDGITIFIANLGGSIDGIVSFDTSYNTKVGISYESLSTAVQRGTGYVMLDDEQNNLSPTAANKNKTYDEGSIYAYTVITGGLVELDANDETIIENIIETRNTDEYETPDDQLLNAETVLAYGDTYTFYASENMCIIPYTQEQFEAAKNAGFINTDTLDENGADVFASPSIINAGTKLSIVSNYILPEGCELIEAGILMKATKDGTTPTDDLTFKTVGKNGVARMKSTQHTVGSQFVISPIQITTAIKGKTITAKYAAYVIYTDANGNTHQIISNAQTASVIA